MAAKHKKVIDGHIVPKTSSAEEVSRKNNNLKTTKNHF
jgi:hypothetical protein